jgi:hypothetical protein
MGILLLVGPEHRARIRGMSKRNLAGHGRPSICGRREAPDEASKERETAGEAFPFDVV